MQDTTGAPVRRTLSRRCGLNASNPFVSVSGYLISSQQIGKQPLPPKAEQQWWYQFYFATERGAEGYAKNTHDFARLIWSQASSDWKFSDATFNASAKSG